MKRILFLDDNKNRWDTFAAYNPDHMLHWADTAEECKACLTMFTYDEVYLDHDLEGKTFVNSDSPNCGMEVVRYIIATKDDIGLNKTRFIVHSWNDLAAHRMCAALREAGLEAYELPFASAVLKIAMQEDLSSEDVEKIIKESPFGDLREVKKKKA